MGLVRYLFVFYKIIIVNDLLCYLFSLIKHELQYLRLILLNLDIFVLLRQIKWALMLNKPKIRQFLLYHQLYRI
jgi:hypothetical protein